MKIFFLSLVVLTGLTLTSCTFDDSDIWDKLNDHENRIVKLEELCQQLNTNIVAMQTIVNALETHDYITNISPIRKDGKDIGYTISFAYGDTITIYHGENGADGKDGNTPKIGVMKDIDGIYYWTLDGEWLLDSKGNKIKAVGIDGRNGTDGKDGIDGEDGANGKDGKDGIDGEDGNTPHLKIENGYWYVSYDNGTSWQQLCKATGEDGIEGEDGINGADGKDGITPLFKIEAGYWYISYDNSKTWTQLGKATGDDGKDGKDGLNGVDGEDGEDGTNGKDGNTPHLKIENDYWYVSYDNGKSWTILSKATGKDGKDGEDGTNGKDGQDGVTPRLKIENGYWYVSYDDSKTWAQLGKATGDNGKDGLNGVDGVNGVDGKDGDSFFTSVTQDDENVYFTFADGSIIAVPKVKSEADSGTIIYYTTYDGNIIEPYASAFDGNIISNTYKNGKGTIKFDRVISKIGNYAFTFNNSCYYLTSITIPDNITIIEEQAFQNPCLKAFYGKFASSDNRCLVIDGQLVYFAPADLTQYNIPSSVTTIGNNAFNCCSLTAVTIPNTVTSIGLNCFAGSALQSVRIPDSVISIDDYAFSECNLSSLVIGNNVTSIGEEAFARCNNLTNVTIPSRVISIGGGAFVDCWNLESVTIGSGVVEIGRSCFANCDALTNIYCKPTIPPAIHCTDQSGAFPFNSGMRIYVPSNSYNTYTQYTSFSTQMAIAQTNWYGYKSYIVSYNF